MNEKIQRIVQDLDKKVFELRMGLVALQSELGDAHTVSLNEQGVIVSPESETEPDGFHGKSYKDFEKSRVLPEWKNALCAEKSLSAHIRPLKYGTVLMMQPMPIVYGKLLNWQCMESNHGW